MKTELLFIGYRCFKSKSEKMCYILSFLTPPTETQDKNSCYTTQVDLFTDETNYKSFININKLFEYVELNYEIVGDKVRYTI